MRDAESLARVSVNVGRRILVTGGTGLIGSEVVRALADRGDVIVATSRRPAAVPGATTSIQWNPDAGALPRSAYRGCDAVVNLAGAPVGTKRWTQQEKEQIRSSRLTVTQHLGDAVNEEGIPVFLTASAVGYYGPHGEDEIDESTAVGVGFRADVCFQWEQVAMKASSSGARVVVLRTGSVLARHGPLHDRLKLFSTFWGHALGTGKQWVPWVHIADVVGLVLMALDDSSIRGPINVTAPNPVRQRDLAATICRVRHRPSVVRVPALLMSAVYGDAATFILTSQRAVPTAALSAGYRFRYKAADAAIHDLFGTTR